MGRSPPCSGARLGCRAAVHGPFSCGQHSRGQPALPCPAHRNPSPGGKGRGCHFSSWKVKVEPWSQERSFGSRQLPVLAARRRRDSCDLGRALLCPCTGTGLGQPRAGTSPRAPLCFSLQFQGCGGPCSLCGAAPELPRSCVSILGSQGCCVQELSPCQAPRHGPRQQSRSVCSSPCVGHGPRGCSRGGISSWALGVKGHLTPGTLGEGPRAQPQHPTASTPGGT